MPTVRAKTLRGDVAAGRKAAKLGNGGAMGDAAYSSSVAGLLGAERHCRVGPQAMFMMWGSIRFR
jgi:hypothetical protein